MSDSDTTAGRGIIAPTVLMEEAGSQGLKNEVVWKHRRKVQVTKSTTAMLSTLTCSVE